ncbi:Serine-protein kinase RsbW [Myxococcus hansupus]|uniref:Serine-protein kinase RsbW n=2 Tax=Pseudomyxococcus hansupus TaxID=1297742 RepID=A0A0H4WR53_9BACT|nr:Serine-protein kinase RsbW [Myxococcus hansupus]
MFGESRLEFIDRVTAGLRRFLEDVRFFGPESEQVELAVAEAVANAIQHGNQGQMRRRVEVGISYQDACITVCVRDEGNGFDVAAVPDATSGARLLVPSGRGVLLMRALMDEVEFSRHPRGGAVVRLSKQRFAVPPLKQE